MGLMISFLGSLPLGTMNIAVTHIAIAQGSMAGLQYALGSLLAEIIIVRVILVAMNRLAMHHKIFQFLEMFTVVLILILSVASFVAAYKMTAFSEALPFTQSVHPFWTGVILSVTNPLHIPFWLGWSTLLMNKKILLPDNKNYNSYISGIAIGTIAGFAVFIYGGIFMVEQITEHQVTLNFVIGFVLLCTALIQLRKILSVSAEIRYGGRASG